jgi:hypothetical protein
MIEVKQLEFLSKACKIDKHSECFSAWEGLGFLITCYCLCHKQKQEQEALAEVEDPNEESAII